MLDLGAVKKDFSILLSQVQPWTLSHFVMWLDIKVAEYKVFGRMIMDNTPNDTPQWLRASADYLEQQQKEAQAQAAAQGERELSPTIPTSLQPPLSPRSAQTLASLKPAMQQITSNCESVTSFAFATNPSSQFTVSTVNNTVVSPSVSPATSVVAANVLSNVSKTTDSFQKPSAPVSSPDVEDAFQNNTQRIPPISHLSPKHIRQSHITDQNLTMSLPVSLAAGKESLTTAEVESQIAVLESQIAAVNRSLKKSAQATTGFVESAVPTSSTTSKSGRRKADTTTDENASSAPFATPTAKKSRQQSPVRAVSAASSVEGVLPPLHTSMDMLARMHRLDSEAIPESLRSQNIQSTLEAFEALRTQTFPPSSEALRAQIAAEVQNSAQDMSLHHLGVDRDQMAAYVNQVDPEQNFNIMDREQTYTPTSDTTSVSYANQQHEIRVKVEAGQSDEDSMGMGDVNALRGLGPDVGGQAEIGPDGTQDEGTYPVSMYAAVANSTQANADDKLAAELSTKKMRRKFLESMKNSNPKYYSHQIQQIIPFPDKFPVANLDYGLKALQMIQTGEITRAGKIQLIDTIFHELIKYTGLYPTPTQKMAVANAIVETFPTLAAKMKASHISPADSWYVILCDKFRNERRGLGGAGASPRLKGAKKEHHDSSVGMGMEQQVAIETIDDSGMEMRQGEVEEIVTDSMASQAAVTQAAVAAVSAGQYHEGALSYQQNYTQVSGKEVGVEMTSDDDEEDQSHVAPLAVETEKTLSLSADERRQLAEKKRSVRRKTHSPKRVQKAAEMPILDERYAASLLEYYSKHKPYYPVDPDLSRQMEVEATKGVVNDQALVQVAANQVAVSQAIAQAVASHAVASDEPYSAEVAAIVQNVVSAHMDEVLAARNYQPGVGSVPTVDLEGLTVAPTSMTPEVGDAVEVKTSKKKVVPQKVIPQKERTPEQQQVTLQRFKQKLAITYPGVQAVDDSTLLCTCGAKVKLGRARMLHNYSNYHLKRCQNPPITVRHETHSPSIMPVALHTVYPQGSPGEICLPTTGPRVITKELESVAFAGLSAADRETIQKHFLLNVPIPSSDNTLVAGSTSSTPTHSLDLTLSGSQQGVLHIPVSSGGPGELVGQNGSNSSTSDGSLSETGDVRSSESSASVLNVPLPGQVSSVAGNSHRNQSKDLSDGAVSVMNESQSLDLSVHSSGPSVLIEHQPGSDLRVQIPSSIATSIAEYSGELPDLSAINALALIQGKTDQPMETSDTNEQETIQNEEPINLAHT
ncbi:uncharacterized protein LOC128234563 isoform X2 [Mya arenaria]|uniref:uncharacterized protein LOC128234563 isoform X2 n=1 Tax=Mya arenaria TaxID=6604 RepID=UPI0022E86C7D|nr:uncharacterized protein LOC128234563 isoform X2 [Mya arenaria]